ncbi:epidermal growth factor-like protein 6 isoform X2 [Latimeria chalumnae]|uniref:epidermal growth factor-like protein 6 isoform X2 n=1 Tax=Latimeria chalumnae TaxID=7897 RepID=UPI00313C4DE5
MQLIWTTVFLSITWIPVSADFRYDGQNICMEQEEKFVPVTMKNWSLIAQTTHCDSGNCQPTLVKEEQNVSSLVKVKRRKYVCCAGWEQDGYECTKPVCDEPCEHDGTCSAPNTCLCPSGFSGSRCEQDLRRKWCPTNYGCSDFCWDAEGSFFCTCREGRHLKNNGRQCEAVCPQGCQNGGWCSVPGVCKCPAGWTGNSCEISLCFCSHGHCVQPGVCVCDIGWTGTYCNIDVNECSDQNGGCAHSCINLLGYYKCGCYYGYGYGTDWHHCIDSSATRSPDVGKIVGIIFGVVGGLILLVLCFICYRKYRCHPTTEPLRSHVPLPNMAISNTYEETSYHRKVQAVIAVETKTRYA